jgi:hypothetical protein
VDLIGKSQDEEKWEHMKYISEIESIKLSDGLGTGMKERAKPRISFEFSYPAAR